MASIFKKAKDRSSRDKMRTTSGTSIHSYNPNNPLNAPTEVAQATQSHIARNANELSFKKGDFFHIFNNNNNVSLDGTIEIFDPIHNTKGRAPASCFKIFEKTHRSGEVGDKRLSSNNSTTNLFSNSSIQQGNRQSGQRQVSTSSYSSEKEKALGNLFGVVLYDFNAERSDELSVVAGDIIFICAHHDYEWYIAKFLNKVGEVGLVPVSYVQLIDAVTRIPFKESPRLIIENENLPTVDEWKAVKNKHKASSRVVGIHSNDQYTNNDHGTLSRNGSARSGGIASKPFGKRPIPVQTNIEYFTSTPNTNKFWFLVKVIMSDGHVRYLCRFYEDFFNFHQKLLSSWPREGGKFDTKEKRERILPFIPGPIIDVTESLCHKRMVDLNEYLIILLQLPDYISKSSLVLSFFDLLDGDETAANPNEHVSVKPNRAAPNLKIINTDNRQSQQNKFNSMSSTNSTTQQYTENPSQSNYDRRSQYDIRNSSYSNKFSDLARKSSSASSLTQSFQQMNIQHQPIPDAREQHEPSNNDQLLYNQNKTTKSSTSLSVSSKPSSGSKFKLKFYYLDDIFAIVVPSDTTLSNLKSLITPKINEADIPGIESKIQIYSKNSINTDYQNYNESECIRSDTDLWNDENFTDKGKFLIIV